MDGPILTLLMCQFLGCYGHCQKCLSIANRVRYFRGRVTNFYQSEARKHCILDSDWLNLGRFQGFGSE